MHSTLGKYGAQLSFKRSHLSIEHCCRFATKMRFPQTPVYRPRNSDPLSFDHLERLIRLPRMATQTHLLHQYFHYVHPIFPLIDRDQFWDEWSSLWVDDSSNFVAPLHQDWERQKNGSGGPPKLLLLAIFALVARYSDSEGAGQSS